MKTSGSQDAQRRADSYLYFLAEREAILSLSPYLRAEIHLRRRALHLAEAIERVTPETEGDEADLMKRDVELHDLTERDDVVSVAAELVERYEFAVPEFFSIWLVTGQPTALVRAVDDDSDQSTTARMVQKLSVRVLLNPDVPVDRFLFGRKRPQLQGLSLVLQPWTTRADIDAIWGKVERLQRQMVGYRGERRRSRPNLDRDLFFYDVVRVQGRTVRDAIKSWNNNPQVLEYTGEDSTVRRSLNELDELMKPVEKRVMVP